MSQDPSTLKASTLTLVQEPVRLLYSRHAGPYTGIKWEYLLVTLETSMSKYILDEVLALLDRIKTDWQSQGFVWTDKHSWLLVYGRLAGINFVGDMIDDSLIVRGFEIHIFLDGQRTDKVIRFTTTRSR